MYVFVYMLYASAEDLAQPVAIDSERNRLYFYVCSQLRWGDGHSRELHDDRISLFFFLNILRHVLFAGARGHVLLLLYTSRCCCLFIFVVVSSSKRCKVYAVHIIIKPETIYFSGIDLYIRNICIIRRVSYYRGSFFSFICLFSVYIRASREWSYFTIWYIMLNLNKKTKSFYLYVSWGRLLTDIMNCMPLGLKPKLFPRC